MEDPRAVIRELRGLAVVHLGDDARVGDALRIGGHEAVDFLEKRELFGADAARQDGGGEVAAAAAEGDDGAVGAAGDVPGHHHHDAVRQKRGDDFLGRALACAEVGPERAEAPLGVDDVDGVDVRGRDAVLLERGGEDLGDGALAARREGVLRPRRQLLQHRDALGHRGHLVRGRGEAVAQALAGVARGDQLADEVEVPRLEFRHRSLAARAVAAQRGLAGVEKEVGNAVHRRDDDGDVRRCAADVRDGAADRLRAPDGDAAELVDLRLHR